MPVKILPQVSGLVWAMALDQSVLLEVLDALRNADADQSNQAGENGLSGCTPSTRSAIVFASLGADDAAGGQKCRGHRSEAVSSHAI